MLASPSGGPGETFRVAGMVNPAIVVTAGARVSMEVVNADPGNANGLVDHRRPGRFRLDADDDGPDRVPRFGAVVPRQSHRRGHARRTLSFTAAVAGAYRYLCPVPGHAQEGMAGAFIVSAAA